MFQQVLWMPRPHYEGQLEVSVHAYLWMADSLGFQAPALLPPLTPLVQLDLLPPHAHPVSQALPRVGSANKQSRLLEVRVDFMTEVLKTAIVTFYIDMGTKQAADREKTQGCRCQGCTCTGLLRPGLVLKLLRLAGADCWDMSACIWDPESARSPLPELSSCNACRNSQHGAASDK